MSAPCLVLLLTAVAVALLAPAVYMPTCAADDPTDGFTRVPLTEANFVIHKPYNMPLDQRYSFVNGVRRLWVFDDSQPFKPGSPTKPHTEIRVAVKSTPTSICTSPVLASLLLGVCLWQLFVVGKPQGHDYSSGVRQFEGYGYMPAGTTGTSIMQIHRSTNGSTEMMLSVYDGELRNYRTAVVAIGVYDQWMRINVIHNANTGEVRVFVDGKQRLQVVSDKGPATFYFK